MNAIISFLIISASFILGKIANNILFNVREFSTKAEEYLFNVIFGFGFMGLLLFVVGYAGMIFKSVIWLILIILSILTVISIYKERKSLAIEPIVLSKLEKGIIFLIFATSFFYIILSFLPVTNADSLNHILHPLKYYVINHRIFNLSQQILYSSYPQLLASVDMVFLVLSDEIGIQSLHVLIAFITCLTLFVVACKNGNRLAGLLIVLAFMTSSVFFDMSYSTKIDIGIAFYTAAVFYALVQWEKSKISNWFVIASIFCAFAFSTKYNGGFIIILPLIAFLSKVINRKYVDGDDIKICAKSVIAFFVIISPWLMRNYIETRNPFSPFLASHFHDTSLNMDMIQKIKKHFAGFRIGYFSYLLNIVLGMPILAFSVNYFSRSRNNFTITLAFWGGLAILLISNIFLPQVDRVFLPTFVLLFYAIGFSIYSLINSNKSLVRTLLLIVFVAMVGNGLWAITHEVFRKDNIGYLCSAISKDYQLSRQVHSYPLALEMNKAIANKEKVLLLGDLRGYYFNQDIIYAFSLLGNQILNSNNIETISSEMRSNHIQYFIYSREPCFESGQQNALRETGNMSKYFQQVIRAKDCSLYKLREI